MSDKNCVAQQPDREPVAIQKTQPGLSAVVYLDKSGAYVSVSINACNGKHQDEMSKAIKEFCEKLNQIDCSCKCFHPESKEDKASKEINHIKRVATKNAIWIDTAGVGLALAVYLENKGVPINRFTLLDQQALQQYLNSGKHKNYQQSRLNG